MAIGVIVQYINDEHEFPRRILLVDALGVSGGDQCHRLTKGEKVELWLGSNAKITLKDDGADRKD